MALPNGTSKVRGSIGAIQSHCPLALANGTTVGSAANKTGQFEGLAEVAGGLLQQPLRQYARKHQSLMTSHTKNRRAKEALEVRST